MKNPIDITTCAITLPVNQGAFHAFRPEDLRRGVSFPVGVDIA